MGRRPVDKIDNLINFVTMSRLTIEIEPDQHRQIKTMATFAGMTIKEFILAKTLGESLDEGIDTTAELLADPENAKRLREAIAEPASNRRVFESMEELKNALGI